MFRASLLMFLLLAASLWARPALTVSAGYGYTHYSPDDLNEVNRIFEKTSQSIGFRGYTVEPFSGHGESMLSLGLQWKHVACALEVEVWRETFSQRNVPFSVTGFSGSVNADENYLFLPACLMFKYPFFWRRLYITPGYGPGIMFGNATVNMVTDFTSSRSDDEVTYTFTSGVNIIHRFNIDAFYRVLPWAGIGFSGGWRISQIPYLEVSEKKGNSFMFNLLFNGGADKGDRLYTGYETLSFVTPSENQSFHHLVVGDMTGYYLWLKMVFLIGEKR
ncbi:MAG: hypothetical protein V1913_01875 [Fibrobacterota bacterium]